MTRSHDPAADADEEEEFFELSLDLERRVARGERLDLERLQAEHPRHAEMLAEYLRGGQLVADGLAVDSKPPTIGAEGLETLTKLLQRLRAEGSDMARYTLRDELGRGGWGVVVQGDDTHLGRTVALKRLTGAALSWVGEAPVIQRPRVLARFLEEAQVTSQLDHPGIVPVHELGLDASGAPFFAMKLVKGLSFDQGIAAAHAGQSPRVDRRFRTELGRGEDPRPWTVERALDVLERVAEALAYAHHKGVVHRDLKPHNVIVGRFGEVFLLDWGLANVVAESAEPVELTDGWRTSVPRTVRSDPAAPAAVELFATEQGETLGTPCYLAPESLGVGHEGPGPVRASFAMDVYGLGALLYHVLAGHPPYAEPGTRQRAEQVLARIATGPPEPLGEAAPAVPAPLVDLCSRSMARAPEDRPGSAEAWLDELRAAREPAPHAAGERPASPPPATGSRRAALAWLPWILLAFALGLWAGRFAIGS